MGMLVLLLVLYLLFPNISINGNANTTSGAVSLVSEYFTLGTQARFLRLACMTTQSLQSLWFKPHRLYYFSAFKSASVLMADAPDRWCFWLQSFRCTLGRCRSNPSALAHPRESSYWTAGQSLACSTSPPDHFNAEASKWWTNNGL